MGSLGQRDGDKGETLQQGCFPSSSKRSLKASQSISLNIFGHEDIKALNPSTLGGIARIANISWALLLRAYLRTNLISFRILHNRKFDDAEDVHYRLLDHNRLDEVQMVDARGPGKFGYNHVDINTAINQNTTPRSAANGKDIYQYLLILNVSLSRPEITIDYAWPAISEPYAQAVASTYQEMFTIVCHQGNPKLSEIDSISRTDCQAMVSWNPPNPFASEEYKCMHHLVEAKVKEIPKVEAICAWDGSLTYFELNHLADLAARRLIGAGVRPGVFVPFAYEKTLWAVVATLAILKAGGAFVPINPNDPESRLADILGKVSANVVVTMEKFVPKFSPLAKAVIVISDEIAENGESHNVLVNGKLLHDDKHGCFTGLGNSSSKVSMSNSVKSAAAGEVRPTDPMVVLFTSGSTGQPKGIVLEHRAICTHAVVHGSRMSYHNARVLQFAAHTFDVAIMDYFTTLLFGGCICIPSEEERKSDIIGVINSMRVDYAILTPSFAGLIDPSEVPTMRTLAIGGEALPQDRVQRWSETVNLIQIYGPAEAGICLAMDMKIDTAPETVGFPLCNSSCWLVDPDDYDVLVPIGVIGELMIAGPSVAGGYLNNEAKTRASFINKPHWATKLGLQCERYYLSGDLLRYNTSSFDGSYDFIGRKDAQIKLRGQRIEPSEIEYHIGKIAGVAVSMVTRPHQGVFTDELVCIVQMHNLESKSSQVRNEPICLTKSQDLTARDLRHQLAKALPTYMIPSTCLAIETMPLVPSLKIDRRRVNEWLIGLETPPGWTESNPKSPLLPSELTAIKLSQKISSIVAPKDERRRSALSGYDFGLQTIGINSIQIISLSMYLRREHSLKIPMDTLLSPDLTVRTLAQMIDGLRHSKNGCTNGSHYKQPPLGMMSSNVNLVHEVEKLTAKLLHGLQPSMKYFPDTRDQAPVNYNLFLTGATGYLGSLVLQRLLQSPNVDVFVLVRCPSQEEGMDRIIISAKTYQWWRTSYADRIHVWRGDLTKPNLGLEPDNLRMLEGSTAATSRETAIHGIIHNGARVHYSSSYATLLPVNISPTLELLRITANSPHVSTFVFVSGGLKPNILLPPTLSHSQTTTNILDGAGGYAQTKYISSALVEACLVHPAFQCKKLRIVKPGYIMGSPSTAGVANTSDFIWRLVAGCVEIGAFNADEADHWLFIADVEEVADAVVSGIASDGHDNDSNENSNNRLDKPDKRTTNPNANATKPILTGLPFSTLWKLLQSKFAYNLQPLPHNEWLSRLKSKVIETGDEHLLFPLLHVLERDGGRVGEKISLAMGAGKEEEGVLRAVEANVRFLIGAGVLPTVRG